MISPVSVAWRPRQQPRSLELDNFKHRRCCLVKKFDFSVRLGYTYKHIRDSSMGGERGRNCPRTQTVPCFRAVFVKKSRIGQCTRGFVRFLGRILRRKKSRAVRVFFWASGATAPLGLKWGLLLPLFPFEGN